MTEPAFLQMDKEKQCSIIKDCLEGKSESARDAFLFVFENHEDMETFLFHCVDEQRLRVHAMFSK